METTFWPARLRPLAFAIACLMSSSVFAATPVTKAPPATDSGATILVLDASGSMRERIKGETKMEIARRAVRALVQDLPDDTRLGLVVYSHRKATDCEDIELVIPPAKLDKAAFVAAVDRILPLGRTPLTAAVEFAANALDFTRARANVILISDGLETCGRDPCATVRQLEARGANFTVHAVAFDLTAKEAQTFECLATETGGRFLQAKDAASLQDALQVAVIESTVAANTPPPAEVLGPATVKAAARVVAGAALPVEWTGPNNPGDYITIVPEGTPDGEYFNFTYTRQGSPLDVTALITPGKAEIRYVTSHSRSVLARAPVEILAAEVTLNAPEETTAGAEVAITWTGPNNNGDYITIVPKGTEDGGYARYANTRQGPTLNVVAPVEPGEAEIRYMSGQGRQVLARRALKVTAAEVTLSASDEAVAGSDVSITWTGPNNNGDYITIVPKNAGDDVYAGYAYAQQGSPQSVRSPIEPGETEIRYVSGQGRKVLARRDLRLVAAEVSLVAPDTIVAGAQVEVTWTGPNNNGDYITVVPKDTPDGRYGRYTYTQTGSPLKVLTPIETGEHEIRYMSGQGGRVLARRSLRLEPPQITLQPPARATAGTMVEVPWTGPDNQGDYITIVPKDAPDGTYSRYVLTYAGSPARILAPATTGPHEVRYMSNQGNRVLAREVVELVAAGQSP